MQIVVGRRTRQRPVDHVGVGPDRPVRETDLLDPIIAVRKLVLDRHPVVGARDDEHQTPTIGGLFDRDVARRNCHVELDRVGAAIAFGRIVVGVAANDVAPEAAAEAVDVVIARAGQQVVAGAADDDVVAAAPVYGVVARETAERVVAVTAFHAVVAEATREGVGGGGT